MIERRTVHALPIHALADLERFGTLIAQSELAGQINPAVGTIIASILYSKEMTLEDFLRQYDIVGGKISMKAHTMLARFVALGGSYKIDSYTSEQVSIRFSFAQNKDLPFTLTIAEVHAIGLDCDARGKQKSTWAKHPRSMLFARVISEAVRVLCPAAAAGIYTPEEVSDFDGSSAVPADLADFPAPSAPESRVDYEVCPFDGEWKGKRWEEMPNELLQLALGFKATPEPAKPFIRAILVARTHATLNPETETPKGTEQ